MPDYVKALRLLAAAKYALHEACGMVWSDAMEDHVVDYQQAIAGVEAAIVATVMDMTSVRLEALPSQANT